MSAMASGADAVFASVTMAAVASRNAAKAVVWLRVMRCRELLAGKLERARPDALDLPLTDDLAGFAIELAVIRHGMAHSGGTVIRLEPFYVVPRHGSAERGVEVLGGVIAEGIRFRQVAGDESLGEGQILREIDAGSVVRIVIAPFPGAGER